MVLLALWLVVLFTFAFRFFYSILVVFVPPLVALVGGTGVVVACLSVCRLVLSVAFFGCTVSSMLE